MSVTTSVLTANFYEQGGQPYEGVTLTAVLYGIDVQTKQYVARDTQTTTSDATGLAQLTLFANASGTRMSYYRITATAPNGVVISDSNVSIPATNCNLADVEGNWSGEIFTGGSNVTVTGNLAVLGSTTLNNFTGNMSDGSITNVEIGTLDFSAAGVAEGQLTWNSTDGTLDLGLKGGNVTLQIGQEQVVYVYNNTGSTLTDGQVVYVTGSQGQRLTVALAQGNSEATSTATIAVVTEHITNNQSGFATASGLVRDLDTSAFAEGAALYLSPSVAGGITTTEPLAPNHAVRLGWCVRSHPTQGQIFVHVQNGYELDELHDVLITTPSTGQLLTYDGGAGYWKNSNALSVNSTSPALTITQTGTGNALVVEDANPDASPVVIDALGNVAVGYTSATEKLEVVDGNIAVTQVGTIKDLLLQRQTTPLGVSGTPGIRFRMYSTGSTYETGAQILMYSSSAWTPTSTPGDLYFLTTASGTTSPNEKLRITSSGIASFNNTAPKTWASGIKPIQVGAKTALAYYDLGSSTAHYTVLGHNVYNDGTDKYIADGFASQYYQNEGSHVWRIGPTGVANAALTFTQAMTLDANGNFVVGSGTGVGQFKLYAAGAYQDLTYGSTTGSTPTVSIDNTPPTSTTGYASLQLIARGPAGAGSSSIANLVAIRETAGSSATAFAIQTRDNGGGYSEKMRLDSSGNLGLGVTPSAWATSAAVKAIELAGGTCFWTYNNALASVGQNYYYDLSYRYKQTGVVVTDYYQTAGAHVWRAAPSGTAGDVITFTQILAGEKDKSLALQGATTQTGTGITFPATQSASSNANTLDDYEEGTFTPTVVGTSTAGTATYTEQSGYYQKVGNRVHVHIKINYSGHTGTGNLRVSGLPFTANSNASGNTILCPAGSNLTFTNQLSAYMIAGQTYAMLGTIASGAGITDLPIDAAATIYITGDYYV